MTRPRPTRARRAMPAEAKINTIGDGIAKWKHKARDAVRIGRGVTVSPAWLLELLDWYEQATPAVRELERVGADVIAPFDETEMGKWLKSKRTDAANAPGVARGGRGATSK